MVATDIPGCREVIQQGKNGLLIPPREVLSLVKALETILVDQKLRKKMGIESRKIALSHFSVEIINAATISEYNKSNNFEGINKKDR